ncbi:MAG: hypothetical protein A2W20_04965 [Candidatus Aminicenantes bacterium RBG_16_66_30]|nr:MAG: hypothetical protein A2W20_04965 [Candidatus Aminicenantes bacterium RBG_16_66_30]
MAEKAIFTGKEVSFLRELRRQGVDYMIVGAAAAALQGAPIVTQDIDLWFRDFGDPGLRKALAKVGGVIVPSIGLHPPTFAGGAVELFDVVLTMHGLGTFDEEKKHTILVDLGRLPVRILSLDRIIKSKETVGRTKDILTLPVLKDALAAIKKKKSLKVGRPKGRAD